MAENIQVRESRPADDSAITKLYPAAFPDEDLLPLLRELLEEEGVLSLVALFDGKLAGHVAFTMCGISGKPDKVAMLAPLAVAPEMQMRGVGSALVRDGLQRLKADGIGQVQVLGDPAYYGRFGFEPDSQVSPPYPLPEEWITAWQSINLSEGEPALQGALSVPSVWRQPALWLP